MKTRNLRRKYNLTFTVAIIATVLTLGTTSCKQTPKDKQNGTVVQQVTAISITEQEVLDAQKAWGEGIVKIGKVYLEKGDYKTAALNHINEFYNYEQGPVLFKPTLVSQKQFRTDLQGALSYFVSGDENYPEDHGFAIKPWSAVRWENIGTKITGNMAVAMGNYYFTPAKGGEDVKVEYSFAYSKDEDGKLKIILHDSHLPYTPVEKH
ncbi:MAG: hypothetical protein WC780_08315 [Lentimicrobiaceae bacterium]|jgi:hypothetical protein